MKKQTIVLLFCLIINHAFAQKDTLRVMGYNVLYYGNGCQGANSNYHGFLSTIVKYANPDILSMVKVASIPVGGNDKYATAPLGFADSILQFAMNTAFADRYAYCPFTNASKSTNIVMLFYDKHKLGFAGIVSSYSNIIDFNTYKLYYKDPNLETTHDTTFLYLTLNHDKSGDEYEPIRSTQIKVEMQEMKKHFKHLPNSINMGDFNVRGSDEQFYQLLTATDDTGFRFYDPPFSIDNKFSYPSKWDHDGAFAAYFTTSTRENESVPNSCGSGGGAKGWYDHIFLSKWLVNNTNYIKYIPNSYKTIGNDGKRYRVGINNKNTFKNTSAPDDVIEALYRMSNKYPVMVLLEVSSNTTGKSPIDPEIWNVPVFVKESVSIATNPVGEKLFLHFTDGLIGQELTVECFDKQGVSCQKKDIVVAGNEMELKCKVKKGEYMLKVYSTHNMVSEMKMVKQ